MRIFKISNSKTTSSVAYTNGLKRANHPVITITITKIAAHDGDLFDEGATEKITQTSADAAPAPMLTQTSSEFVEWSTEKAIGGGPCLREIRYAGAGTNTKMNTVR